jgi:hypothetical protein
VLRYILRNDPNLFRKAEFAGINYLEARNEFLRCAEYAGRYDTRNPIRSTPRSARERPGSRAPADPSFAPPSSSEEQRLLAASYTQRSLGELSPGLLFSVSPFFLPV